MSKDCGLNLEQLLDFIDGRLASADKAAIETHLASPCAFCASRLSWANDVIALMRTDRLVNPPVAVIQRARNLRLKNAVPAGFSLRSLFATLVFDSRTQPIAAGARGQAGTVRRRMYEVGGSAVLDIQEEPLDSGFAVVEGQLHIKRARAGEAAGAQVALRPSGTAQSSRLEASTNALGEFTFIQVPVGQYSLSVTTRDLEIVVPHLDL